MSKPYIELLDGTKHVLGAPFTPDVRVMAKALSHINRYTGHAGGYSVAQHSVICAEQAPEGHQLAALLHDAHEAYIGDMSAPLKRLVPEYVKLERFYHDQIDDHYGVRTRHREVRNTDLRVLATEALQFGMEFWRDLPVLPYPDPRVVPVCAAHAEERFLETYYRLTL